jgi:hypothetical protein
VLDSGVPTVEMSEGVISSWKLFRRFGLEAVFVWNLAPSRDALGLVWAGAGVGKVRAREIKAIAGPFISSRGGFRRDGVLCTADSAGGDGADRFFLARVGAEPRLSFRCVGSCSKSA